MSRSLLPYIEKFYYSNMVISDHATVSSEYNTRQNFVDLLSGRLILIGCKDLKDRDSDFSPYNGPKLITVDGTFPIMQVDSVCH